ncbi:MAG: heme-binding domain-containing protein [Flavobacteriales bacterium]|nr:heme-binding domain-containing protein [Flavobacteriales bacterium]NCP59957.1 heme-binding domain-containing protein [Flavobacteriales bacterium]PIY13379.1 MAG: cytochrome C [Flavobacteriaceae bacterium CG_4_10_14_3_um_filter_33_47]PJB19706.1 MAG: cytochrome C [Flavobacteriaceae bacterium CG_4_9_14_3_um_filter_33_16]
MKTIKKILLALFIIFVIAQFFGPEKNQGDLASIQPFLNETNPPEDVILILKESCYDCHSDVTRYPWYNTITPLNYWLADHVNEGKKHFNFSNWVGNSVKRKDHKMEELIEMVEAKEMPLDSYTWVHSEAKLSNKQIEAVVEWAKQVRMMYALKPKAE